MWSDIFISYGVFILEVITLLLIYCRCSCHDFGNEAEENHLHGELVITDLSKEFEENSKKLRDFHLTEEELKRRKKQRKKPKSQSQTL